MPKSPEPPSVEETDKYGEEKAPLLLETHQRDPPSRLHTPHIMRRDRLQGKSGIAQTIFNLMNTYIGSGMMSLPHGFAEMGFFLSSGFLAFVAYMCCVGQEIVIRACHISGWRTLTEVSRHELGHWVGVLSQVSIIVNNFGILIVYLIVIGDVLVGTDDRRGVLTSLAGVAPGEVWYLSRWFTVSLVCILVLQPLVLQKRLHHLTGSSGFAVALAFTFGGFMTVLMILAQSAGKGADFQAGLNTEIDTKMNNCGVNIALDGFSILWFAYIGYYNIPPLMNELKDYTSFGMVKSIRIAVAATSVLYFAVGNTAMFTFGDDTRGDILLNLSYSSLSQFMSPASARSLSYIITVGYAIKLMLIYPMENWALRENLSDLFGGSQQPTGWMFYAITYGVTICACLISLSVSSVVWLVSLIGSTTSTIIGFTLPAMLSQRFDEGSLCSRIIVPFYWVLTVVFMFHGLVAQSWILAKESPIYCF
ncbi:hypothetical protein BSKO_07544 [Bryopsis sp. KO-2023]|nr:hypothetical protein BSKO_07544 [Bryopsis sp. KO-2023]